MLTVFLDSEIIFIEERVGVYIKANENEKVELFLQIKKVFFTNILKTNQIQDKFMNIVLNRRIENTPSLVFFLNQNFVLFQLIPILASM